MAEFKLFVQLKNDNFLSYFTRRKDLSGRVTPGVCRQYRNFLGRVAKQRIREARLQLETVEAGVVPAGIGDFAACRALKAI
ncbi:hypothetical protein Tco_0705259 [Tanacetum coccineum]|uniref:ABC transporter family G domain-containing protein n=1 Tax=Tanacetum coccineum TaxID=301880 RepID=A0ABQ4Y432_9ASTR